MLGNNICLYSLKNYYQICLSKERHIYNIVIIVVPVDVEEMF